jgi:hypothetical protein
MCGSSIPDNQGSSSCSMCYGDPYHGKDGYYLAELERAERERQEREQDDVEETEADG